MTKKSENKEKKEHKINIINIVEKIKDKFKKIKDKEIYSRREILYIILSSICIGFLICISFTSIFTGKNYFAVIKDLDKVIDTYYTIVDNYYGELDEDKLVDGAVEGMISSVGDTFTSYTDVNNTETFNETINGSYEGIGCTVATNSNGSIVIIDVFENSPSYKAGIKINDVVIKVDGDSLEGKTSVELSNYIKNLEKNNVVLTVIRDNSEIDITVNLSKVEIPSVTGDIIEKEEKKIGYISISLFANNSYKQFKSKLEELEKEEITGLIIDVRGNSGGYLTSVTDICNLFLEKGKIIYQLQDTHGTDKKKDTTHENRKYGIVVLVNGASASASEILSSAIKESYGGYVVGTNSYGKGTVQETKKLLDGSMIKYTTKKWLTPLGNSIDGTGVELTNYVELNNEYFKNPNKETDNQLQEALKLLIK